MVPLSPTQTRSLLEALDHRPKKPLGQNFLTDGNIVRKSLEWAGITSGDRVVEVGPGLGTLTRALLEAGAEVWAVEFDEALHRHLASGLALEWPQLHLIRDDAVDAPLAGLPPGRPFKIVSNLPYAIATPWMEKVVSGPLPESIVVMLQKECADRFTAVSGTGHYGAVSIFIEAAFHRCAGHPVSRTCFHPVPEVDSLLLHLKRRADATVFHESTRGLIRGLFTQRRKQIGGLINRRREEYPLLGLWQERLAELGIRLTARPEEIPLKAWLELNEIHVNRAAHLQT